jgi:hypothetical protein
LDEVKKTKPPPSFPGGGFDTKPNQAGRLGDFDLANAVNGCVHNESDAVFIPFHRNIKSSVIKLQVFRQDLNQLKKQNHLPVFREAALTLNQTKLGV